MCYTCLYFTECCVSIPQTFYVLSKVTDFRASIYDLGKLSKFLDIINKNYIYNIVAVEQQLTETETLFFFISNVECAVDDTFIFLALT